MKNKVFFLLAWCLLQAAGVRAETQSLERVARAYAVAQPGLQSYRTTIETDAIQQILERMSADLPSGTPLPLEPKVVKYWSRETESSVVRAEGSNVLPLMQEVAQRLSAELTIELRSFLLPAAKAGERERLLEKARIQRSENRLGDTRTETLEIDFAEPVDLNGAFYGRGMEIPQEHIRRLVIDLDPDREILKRIEVTTATSDIRVLEARHYDIKGGELLNEIVITSPDGKVDDRFRVRFDLTEGFWLPVRMYHTHLDGEELVRLYVKFQDYEVNLELPAAIRSRLEH